MSYRIVLFVFFLSASPARALTVLCLGDSLTEGFGVAKDEAWPAVAEKILRQKRHDVSMVNAGISGSTTASGPSRIAWHLKSKQKFDWMFLALGANDGLRGQDVVAAKKNLAKTVQAAMDGGIKKTLIAGMKVPTNYGAAYAKSFSEIFPTLAKERKAPLLPFLLDGVAAKPDLNLPDGIHPNAAGHKIVGERVAKFLESQL